MEFAEAVASASDNHFNRGTINGVVPRSILTPDLCLAFGEPRSCNIEDITSDSRAQLIEFPVDL